MGWQTLYTAMWGCIQIYIEGGCVVPESSQLCFYSLRTVFTFLPPTYTVTPILPLGLQSLYYLLSGFLEKFANLCFRVVVLKFLSTPNALEASLWHRLLGPTLGFWFCGCRMEPEHLPVGYVLGAAEAAGLGEYYLRLTDTPSHMLTVVRTHPLISNIGLGQKGIAMSPMHTKTIVSYTIASILRWLPVFKKTNNPARDIFWSDFYTVFAKVVTIVICWETVSTIIFPTQHRLFSDLLKQKSSYLF